jgi:2-dehydropantoate 2-reductase
MKRVCVVGAGAIGGYVAAMLHVAGADVTVIARGAHLEAIQERGLRVVSESGNTLTEARNIRAFRDIRATGHHDAVILAVKANQLSPIVRDLSSLFHDESVLITMQNGVPWWYFQRFGGMYDGRHIDAVDPDGVIARTIDPRRIIGCVVYPAAMIDQPGVIRHIEGRRFPIGELDGSTTARVTAVSELFTRAGLKAPVLADIRSEIWLKLWGNLSFNPVSALTHATLSGICRFSPARALVHDMMAEAQLIAEALGARFRVPIEQRIAGAEKVGEHKTSMLQDVEAGRHLEVDALVGAIVELGKVTGIAAPSITAVYALTKLLSTTIEQNNVPARSLPPAQRELRQCPMNH